MQRDSVPIDEPASTAAPLEPDDGIVLGDSVLTVDGAKQILPHLRFAALRHCWIDRNVFAEGAFEEPPGAGQSVTGSLVELDSDCARHLSLLRLGEALYRSGRIEEALNFFSDVAHGGHDLSERATAMNNMATIAYQLGDVTSAVQLLVDALKLYPAHEGASANIKAIAEARSSDPTIVAIAELPGVRRLLIGQARRVKGWETFAQTPGDGVDHVGSAADLSRFEPGTFSEIYASDLLERFEYRRLTSILAGFRRVLVPCGLFGLSVVNLQSLATLLLACSGQLTQELHLMRLLYGGQQSAHDYRHAGFTETILRALLETAGFTAIEPKETCALFRDMSDTTLREQSLYLHMSARKAP